MRVAVVTPWQEHRELVEGYFAALQVGPFPDELFIVDNGSEPPLEFATLYSETNLGFCAGSNVGLKHATCDGIVFVNNDISPKRDGWLNEIREALEPGVLVGPIRGDVHAMVDGDRYPYIDGWCLAGMRSDLLALGGFDETLTEPAYWSDNLLCLEARAAGMSLRHLSVGLHHLENTTAGPAHRLEVRHASTRNHARYVARCRELAAQAA